MLTESQEGRLRDALQVLVETMPESSETKVASSSRRQKPALVGTVAFFLVLGIFLPLWLMRGETGPATDTNISLPNTEPNPSTTEQLTSSTLSSPTTIDPGAEEAWSKQLAAYWALEGSLESVNDEAGWLCPLPPAGGFIGPGSSPTPESDVAAELKLALPDRVPTEIGAGDAGPACRQPVALVLLAGTGEGDFEATSGIAVRPLVTRFEDMCPPPSCLFGGAIELFEMNSLPARLHYYADNGSFNLWWFDPNGVPMHAEASGVTRERLLEVAVGIEMDATTGEALADPDTLADLEPVVAQPSIGVWESGVSRNVSYDIDGISVLISTRFDASADPKARYAGIIGFLRLVPVGGTVAVWIGEHGGFLEYRNPDGVYVVIEGSPNVDGAVEVAEALVDDSDS